MQTVQKTNLTHEWQGIRVSEYVHRVINREVPEEYAKRVEGDTITKLIHTLRDTRWFSLSDLQKNIENKQWDRLCFIFTQPTLTNSAKVRDNTKVATTEEEDVPRKPKASID